MFCTLAHSGYILSSYRQNKNRWMQKIKADQAQKWKNTTFCLLQNIRNFQHIYMLSPILIVTLHVALENGSTVPAGWKSVKQMKWVFDDNWRIIFISSPYKHILRVYWEYPQHMFVWRNKQIIPYHQTPTLSVPVKMHTAKPMWFFFQFYQIWHFAVFSERGSCICKLSRLMTKPTKWQVCPAKTQISLGIRPVWSESLLCAQWVAKDPSFIHADSEDSN